MVSDFGVHLKYFSLPIRLMDGRVEGRRRGNVTFSANDGVYKDHGGSPNQQRNIATC